VDTVSVDNVDQRQIVRVQTTEGSASVPAIVAALGGLRLGKVNVREPSLEDAYVRLVGGEA
jgi:ABC-2 type transport system ATP-binding protein